jgi:hypothetical protein
MTDKNILPHLVIPEGDVVKIPKVPTGRPRDIPRVFAKHGEKLALGVQQVEDFVAQNLSSLDNTVVFRLKLHEKHKFSEQAKQDFLKRRGLDIKAVQTNEIAVIASTPQAVQEFKCYIDRYSNTGANKTDLQYVEEITPFHGFDKNSLSLQSLLTEEGISEKPVDVQLMLMPNCSEKQYKKAIEKIQKRIEDVGGTLKREPFFLSDNTPVLRVELTPMQLSSIEEDGAIYRVEETNFFHFDPSVSQSVPLQHLQLAPDANPDLLEPVVVIDTGIDFSKTPALEGFVLEHWVADGVTATDTAHGTQVASRVILGDMLEQQVRMGYISPQATVIDACIVGSGSLSEDELIIRVKKIVETFHTQAKVYNLSMNAQRPIQSDRISLIAYEIDNLSRRFGVVFTISAGNHQVWRIHNSFEDFLDDDDILIAPPADSYLALTVGAINDEDDPYSLSQKDSLSPYSRIGPGFAQNEKPDLVAPGGNQSEQNQTIFGTKVISSTGECLSTAGTSFAAPVVAGHLATQMANIPQENAPMVAKTLLLHLANPQYDYEQLSEDEIADQKRLFGHGRSNAERSISSAAHRVTFVAQGELNRLTKHRVKFYVPEVLASDTGRGHPAIVTVTSLLLPPLDHTKGNEYLGAYVSASLHKIDKKDKLALANPQGTRSGRRKWQSICHYKKSFCDFRPGDWEIWLELFTRWDTDKMDNIPYVLAITLEAPSETTDLYGHILTEVPNRYQPLIRTPVPVAIRQRLQ